MTATCKDGREAFCDCKADIERSNPILCKNILRQCAESFCNPICLRMGWEILIDVDCGRTPGWRGCRAFQEQMHKSQRAISAQFQAHVCSQDLDCCRNETRLVNWVEDHVYADLYPNSHLPLQACAEGAASAKVDVCAMCNAAVTVDILADERRCIPSHMKTKDIMPGGVHERCLFLSDLIANRRDALVEELQGAICSCAGCCEGGCYYKEHDQDEWLSSILDHIEASFGLQ